MVPGGRLQQQWALAQRELAAFATAGRPEAGSVATPASATAVVTATATAATTSTTTAASTASGAGAKASAARDGLLYSQAGVGLSQEAVVL